MLRYRTAAILLIVLAVVFGKLFPKEEGVLLGMAIISGFALILFALLRRRT